MIASTDYETLSLQTVPDATYEREQTSIIRVSRSGEDGQEELIFSWEGDSKYVTFSRTFLEEIEWENIGSMTYVKGRQVLGLGPFVLGWVDSNENNEILVFELIGKREVYEPSD